MYRSEREKENNAQRAARDKNFKDSGATTNTRPLNGSSVEVTTYSDGSSTTHFGGPVGDYQSDENGEEC